MTFIVPIMALGAAAAAIPIIIHLLNRTRYRVVRWGAMHLLDSVVRVNRKRIRFEQIVLLAVRAGIPAACAFFMAKPVLTGWKELPGDVKRSVLVAIDTSYSMEAGGGDQSNFAAARREIDAALAALKRGSDVALIPLAGEPIRPFDHPTVNVKAARAAVAALGGGYGRADVPSSLEAGLAVGAEMNHADRELLVVSDFQRVSWSEEEAGARAHLADLAARMPVRPAIVLFRVGSEHRENMCVESLAFSKLIVGVGQKVQVKATLRNHGEKRYAGLRVQFRVDGRDRETAEISLGPGERAQAIFVVSFETAGSHHVEVAADGDPLAADNALFAAISVWETIPVLLASGEIGTEPLAGETDYLEVALGPFMAGDAKLSDLVRTKVIAASALDGRALQGFRVAVVANAERLSPQGVAALEDFVRSGGGLLLFLGSACDVGWYNAALARSGGLLPARLRGMAGSLAEAAKQTTIVGERFDHEALALFNVPDNGTIAGGEVWQWFPFEGAAEDASILARLATGDPFLIERKCGEGRVIACSTACDADWGNLPMRSLYVPLMGQLVSYLASTVYPPINVEVGKPLVAFLPVAASGRKLAVTLPGGDERSVEVVDRGARGVATFPGTARPGLYTIQGEGIGPLYYVANASREESALDQLSDEELGRVAAELGADIVRSGADYQRLQGERRHGREIWRYFFWGALALLFSELLLEQLFARRRA